MAQVIQAWWRETLIAIILAVCGWFSLQVIAQGDAQVETKTKLEAHIKYTDSLSTKIDVIDGKVNTINENVAKIAGKLEK